MLRRTRMSIKEGSLEKFLKAVSKATGGGITGAVDLSEQVNTDEHFPDIYERKGRMPLAEYSYGETVPRYHYHKVPTDELGGAKDGGIKAYKSYNPQESPFDKHVYMARNEAYGGHNDSLHTGKITSVHDPRIGSDTRNRVIDITKLKPENFHMGSEAELVHNGDIPFEAIVDINQATDLKPHDCPHCDWEGTSGQAPVALDKFLNFLISPVLNFLNPLEKAESPRRRRKKAQPAKGIPMGHQRKELRRLKEYLEHFRHINTGRVLQATAFDDLSEQYQRLLGMKHVGQIEDASPDVPSNKLTWERDASVPHSNEDTIIRDRSKATPSRTYYYDDGTQSSSALLDPREPIGYSDALNVAPGYGRSSMGRHDMFYHIAGGRGGGKVENTPYYLPTHDINGHPYGATHGVPDGTTTGSHTDGDYTMPTKFMHDTAGGYLVATFGGMRASLDLHPTEQTHHDIDRVQSDPEYAKLAPTEVAVNRTWNKGATDDHIRSLRSQRDTNPPIDFRMSLSKLLLQKINFGSSIPGDSESEERAPRRGRLEPEESHLFWLPKKPENEDAPFPLAETASHNHKVNHVDLNRIHNAYSEDNRYHLYPFDREFWVDPEATNPNVYANYWLTEAHKYRDLLEDPENAYKLTYRDHIEGHEAIAAVNNFMTIPNYGGNEGMGVDTHFEKNTYGKDKRMDLRSGLGREVEKRQSHPGLVNIQSPTLWDFLGLQTRHGKADPEWEMAVEKNRGEHFFHGLPEESKFYKGSSLHKPSGGEEQRFVLPNSRRSSSITAQPRWDTGHPEEFLDQLEALLSDAENMEGALGAHAYFLRGPRARYDDPSKEGLNLLERLFPKRTERTEMRSWREAKTIYDQNEELLWEYGIHDLSEYINLSRALNLVTDLDSRIESANTGTYYKIFGRLGEQADPSNPDNWNGGALADLGIQGAISPLIQEAVDYARDTNLRSEGRDSSHTFSKRLGALADFLGHTPDLPVTTQPSTMQDKLMMPLEILSHGSDENKPITPASFYKGTTDQGLNTGVQFQDAVGNHLSSNPIYVSEETKRRGISLHNPLKGRTLLMPFGTNNEALKTFDNMRLPIIQGAMRFVDQAYEQSPAPGVGKRRMSKEVFEGDYYMKNIHDVRMAQYPFYALDGSVGVTVGKGEEAPVDMQDMDEKGYRMGESRNQLNSYTFYHHPRASHWDFDGGLVPDTSYKGKTDDYNEETGEVLPYHETLRREGVSKHHVFYPSREDMHNHAYNHSDDMRVDLTEPIGGNIVNRVTPTFDQIQQEAQQAKESQQYKPFEPPEYDDPWKIPPIQKLLLYIQKEGDGGGDGGDGGGFNGLSGTVFTSANSGIFTPTYGGSKTERRSRKNKKKQDRKRKKLLGKGKQNGVDKLVQFLYDGSPMQKARKPNKDMTGDAATAHAWNNKKSGRMILDWQKVANGNTPNSYMGNPGTLDKTSGAATYPQTEDTSNGITPMPKKANWGENQSYVQKSYTPLIKVASSAPQNWSMPNGNNPGVDIKSGEGTPQQLFTRKDKEEAPGKNADIKQNDMERRIKSYDDKEDENSNIDQPAASMATRGMGNYPNASMQMMAYGSGPNIDELGRGGEKDISHDEEDIDEKERSDVWVPEDKDGVEKFNKLYKSLEEANDPTPLLTALYKIDHE